MHYKNLKLISITISTCLFCLCFSTSSVQAADCALATSGNDSISTSCAINTIDGVDAGTGSTNTAVLTVSTGTITVNSGGTLVAGSISLAGGSIAISTGGEIRPGAALYAVDSDGDGYPAGSGWALSGSTRKNTTSGSTDANDSQYCPDGVNPSGSCNKCSTGAIVYQSSGQDLFSECGGSASVYLNYPRTGGNKSCNTICSTKSANTGSCNGSGGCGSKTARCISIGTDGGGTNMLYYWFRSSHTRCTTSGASCSTTMSEDSDPDAEACSGYWPNWTRCRCGT